MKLGKAILTTLLGAFVLGATAQAQIGVIVRGGYQAANMKNAGETTKMVHGARAGVAADITIYEGGMSRISLQPGVDFAMKGSKASWKSLGEGSLTTTLYYVDVPVLANFSFDLGNSLGVFVNAGPYLGIGLSGTQKSEVKIAGIEGKSQSDIKPFEKDGWLKRLDWGAQVGAGVEFNRFQVGVGTQFGIANLSNNELKLGGTSIKLGDKKLVNNDFFVTVGYRF